MRFFGAHWPAVETALAARGKFKDKLKVGLGALLFPAQTARWRAFLDAHPGLPELAATHPRLLHKIYRPYLSKRLACADRVDALMGHYGLLFEAGARRLVESAARRPLILAAFGGKGLTPYQLRLSAIDDGHREGEFCLWLMADGVALYALTFILLRERGGSSLKIGSLQGVRSEHGAQWIRQATRDLHGCRPRNLLVAAVRDIGAYFGCAAAILVSNRNRVAINWHRRRHIHSDYDAMWRDMGAAPRQDGDFELPCSAYKRVDFDSVPSKKRSEAKKRAALLESVYASVRARLDGMLDGPAPAPAMLIFAPQMAA